jgi:hypothetical protein
MHPPTKKKERKAQCTPNKRRIDTKHQGCMYPRVSYHANNLLQPLYLLYPCQQLYPC